MCSGSLTLAITRLHPRIFANEAVRILVSSDVVVAIRKSNDLTSILLSVSIVFASPRTVKTSNC